LATVRMYKVAELLGLSSQEAMTLLKSETGIDVKSASSSIEEIVARQFVERQARKRQISLPTGPLFADTPALKKPVGKGGKAPEPPKPAEKTVPVEKKPEPKVEPKPAADPAPKTATPETPAPGETPSTGRDATTIKTPGLDFPFPEYLRNVMNQIYRRWRRPTGNVPLRAEIFFLVRRDGSIADVRFVKRSGNFSYDLEAQGAIEAAGNAKAFGPLPDGWETDVLPISFYFEPRSQ